MAGRKIQIWVNKDLLETVGVLSDLYPNLFSLFTKNADFIIDITKEELDQELSNFNSDLSLLKTGFDLNIKADCDFFNSIKNDYSILADQARCIFFLNINAAEAQILTDKYGVLVFSQKQEEDISYFSVFPQTYKRILPKNEEITKGWEGLFSQLKLAPRNSIVINDSYLFKNSDTIHNFGFENIKDCLKALMPPSFDGVFQVFILSDHHNLSSEKLAHIIGQLKSFLKSTFKYDIKVEAFFASGQALHKRRLYLGYQTIELDKGFYLFKSGGRIQDDNEIIISSCFNPNDLGDSQYYMDSIDFEKILKICRDTGARYKAKVERKNSDSVLLVGDYNKSDYLPHNRLLLSMV